MRGNSLEEEIRPMFVIDTLLVIQVVLYALKAAYVMVLLYKACKS